MKKLKRILFILALLPGFGCGEQNDPHIATLHYRELATIPKNSLIEIYYAPSDDSSSKCHRLLANPESLPTSLILSASENIDTFVSEQRSHLLMEGLSSSMRYLIFIRVLGADTKRSVFAGCLENVAVLPGRLVDVDMKLLPVLKDEEI